MKYACVLTAAMCVAQVASAQEEAAQKQLQAVRARMAATLKSLPNYVCLQTTERLHATGAKAKPKLRDTVKLDVAHVGNKEMYSWPGRNMFDDSQLRDVVNTGLVGTGAYASQMIDILFGPGTQFRWVGKEKLGAREVLRWDFTVPKAQSDWNVEMSTRQSSARMDLDTHRVQNDSHAAKNSRKATVGAEGSLWADARTLQVARMVAHATQFPARFPLKAITRSIDYASVRIGARDVLLPSAVEDAVQEGSHAFDINRSHLGQCREYSTSSTLTFDEAPGPQNQQPVVAAAPTAPQPAPAESPAPAPVAAPTAEPPAAEPAAPAPAAPQPVQSQAAPPAPQPQAASDAPAAQPAASFSLDSLPTGTRIRLGLDQHLRPENAVIGMPVNAHLISDLHSGGRVVARKGTPVHGVLQQYMKMNDGYMAFLYTMTIQFDQLILPEGAVPFRAQLKSVDAPVVGLRWLIPAEEPGIMKMASSPDPRESRQEESDVTGARMKLDAKPGMAALMVRHQPSFHLMPGTPMTWVTLGAESPAPAKQ